MEIMKKKEDVSMGILVKGEQRMTNNEAIEILNLHNPFMTNKTILSEAMDVAVKSLKNSNDTAIKTLEEILEEIDDMSGCDNLKPI